MSYLTRIFINPARRGGRKLITNPEAMHAAVLSCFPPDVSHTNGRILWRLDETNGSHTLFIVSPEQPDASSLIEQAGWSTRPGNIANYGRLLSSLKNGQEWAFRLTANPVESRPSVNGTRGKVLPHVTTDQQVGWLNTKASKYGFELPSAMETEGDAFAPLQTMVTKRTNLRFFKGGIERSKRNRVALRVAQFDGLLRVTDAELLRHSLVNGIGRAKAYGCGLLTLAKPRE